MAAIASEERTERSAGRQQKPTQYLVFERSLRKLSANIHHSRGPAALRQHAPPGKNNP
jgi:hypothetical protein